MSTIQGVQGRYFLPLLPVFLLLVAYTTSLRFNLVKALQYRHFVLGICGLVLLSLLTSSIKYHYITWG